MLRIKKMAIGVGFIFSSASLSFAQAVPDAPPPSTPSTIPSPSQAPENIDPEVSPQLPTPQAGVDQKTPTTAAVESLSDGQIASILQAANQAEIKAAKLARKQAQSQDIKQFAKMMLDDHEQANRELKGVAKRKSIRMNDSKARTQLTDMAKAGDMRIKSMKGTAFDKAYIDEQVTMHQEVLTRIDSDLLPQVRDPDLKSLLDKIRPKIADHLERAKSLQGSSTAGR